MKQLLFSAALFVCTLPLFAQVESNEVGPSIDKYKKSYISPQFEEEFQTNEDKKNFRLLREFLDGRQSLRLALKEEAKSYEYLAHYSYLPYYQMKVDRLAAVLAASKSDVVEVEANLIYGNSELDTLGYRKVPLNRDILQNIITQTKTRIEEYRRDTATLNRLNENIAAVSHDIYSTRKQIDSALAPEYKEQDFRKSISLIFSGLIAVLLISFFVIVYKRSDESLSKDLLSGNGLQFVTLFVLIISVILFGILGILQSSELAAILSGISGYILGKGTQKDLAAVAGSAGLGSGVNNQRGSGSGSGSGGSSGGGQGGQGGTS
jgi:hypothetical protein